MEEPRAAIHNFERHCIDGKISSDLALAIESKEALTTLFLHFQIAQIAHWKTPFKTLFSRGQLKFPINYT